MRVCVLCLLMVWGLVGCGRLSEVKLPGEEERIEYVYPRGVEDPKGLESKEEE